ncbi:MAG: hypothetical protein M0P14_03955 [Alkaliphilus sp.]|nr:hypothetical protein [Alkaliphilus sp.]
MNLKFATVQEIIAGGLKVKFHGETVTSTKAYKKLVSYTSPQIGDSVAMLSVSGTYIILGEVE